MKYITAIMPLLLALLLTPLFAREISARDYTPVDQLGHGATLPKPITSAPPQLRPATAQNSTHQSSRATHASRGTPSKLFGTVEFKKPLATLPGWLDVLKRNAAQPIFNPPKHFTKTVTWQKLRDGANGKSQMDLLRYVNSFWNTWPYREDMANWGVADYWAIPAQFLTKSGDCEDYAIAKYFTLKELGFPPDKMRLVVLRDTVRNLPHAVLVVYLDNDAYVLDNLSKVVLSHASLPNYQPQYSVNETGRWAHIKPKKKSGR